MAAPGLRVVFCTNGGLPGALVLRRLLAHERIRLSGIVLSSRVGGPRQGAVAGALAHCRRSGFAYATHLAMAVASGESVRAIARRERIPCLATPRINEPEACAFVRQAAPDLLVSAFFNQRIGETVAAIPGLGAVNIHPGTLPDFRGVDPVFFALLRGAPELGVTLHRIAPQLDAGPILAQARSAPVAGESVLGATARLYDLGAQLLSASLGAIESRDPGTPQAHGGAYDSWPSRADVAGLRRRGIALARWGDLRGASRIVESGLRRSPTGSP